MRTIGADYLCGMIRGDGMLGAVLDLDRRGTASTPFRPALCNCEALHVPGWLQRANVDTGRVVSARHRRLAPAMHAIGTQARESAARS